MAVGKLKFVTVLPLRRRWIDIRYVVSRRSDGEILITIWVRVVVKSKVEKDATAATSCAKLAPIRHDNNKIFFGTTTKGKSIFTT